MTDKYSEMAATLVGANPPSLEKNLATALVRHVLTGAGAVLVSKGVLDQDGAAAFVQLAAGGVLWAAGSVWTTAKVYANRRHWFEALHTDPAIVEDAPPRPEPRTRRPHIVR
jgi:hypothetical protein